MWHGAQRKTLSVFGAYIVQRSAPSAPLETTYVFLVSDVLSKLSSYGNLCIKEALRHVKRLGTLSTLRCWFDTSNHFRSYENLHCFAVEVAEAYKQRTRVSYFVETHGKCCAILRSSLLAGGGLQRVSVYQGR